MRGKRWIAGLSAFGLATSSALVAPTAAQAVDVDSPVVINEAYGGGGNTDATYRSDFIELFNSGDAAVDLTGWSVQYASSGGSSWQTTPLVGSIEAGAYYLVKQADGENGTVDLPAPDASGSIAMSGTKGKVALVNSADALACGSTCNSDPAVVDYLGWGSATDYAGSAPAPGTNNTTSVSRDAEHTNTGDNAADFTAGDPTPTSSTEGPGDPGDPGDPTDPVEATIEEIQGSGDASPLVDQTVVTRGVVTAAYPTGGLNGYYLQTPGTGGAIDLAEHTTSSGIFVFSSATVGSVSVGDYVQVTGEVSEYAGLTEITVASAADLEQLDEQVDAPTPATTEALPATDEQRESLEGMLYQPSGNFTVTNTYTTNQYGELGLAAGDQPLLQWTEVARPGSPEAAAVEADNAARGIVLDDGASTNFFSAAGSSQPLPYVSLDNPVRVGAPATFQSPVIFSEGGARDNPTYRFQPLAQTTDDPGTSAITWENTRTDAPDADAIGDADLRLASFNVLNYFTTLGADLPGCEAYNDRQDNPIAVKNCPDNGPRGAWNTENLQRQQDKLVAAINGSGANLVGLMEIENSVALGEPADEAVATLVDALNADAGAGTWAYVPSSTELPAVEQQDVITNAIIYQPAAVTPVGEPRALGDQSGDNQAFVNAREPIASEFEPTAGGEKFLFGVNHFKSKGSAGPWPGDEDAGDGQGNSNESRVRQATALRDWIATLVDPATEPVVMVGDYNSYSQEDPLQVLYDAGYVDAEHQFDVGKYSYSYQGLSGSLDHVLLNQAAVARSTGADIWNINSGESIALQYSRFNYNVTNFYAPDQFAASDHDPVLLGFKNSASPSGPKTVSLLNLNDFHGRIDANTVKVAGTVEELREANGADSTVLLSAGDNVGASLFASAFEDDKPTIDVLNALELKASAVGNHEFDKGFADLTDRIMAPFDADTNPHGGAAWKYLGANVYEKGTQTPALPEYELVEVNGVTVGIIGAVTEETPTLVSPAGVADLDFGDPVEAVNRVAGQLTDGDESNGEADVLVAEYHDGAGSGTPDGSTLEEEVAAGGVFARIVTETDASVDAIFTGHTHKEYAWDAPVPGADGATRPILQTGSYGERIGEITLTLNDQNAVTDYTVRNVPRTSTDDDTLAATYPRVATVRTIVDGALDRAAEIGNQPASSVTADITTGYFGDGAGYTGPGDTYVAPNRDDRGKESTLGNLVADSLVSSLSPQERGGATIGVVNPGGLRNELLAAEDGVITYAEANAVLPFVNNLWTITLTGEQFVTMLEQQWQTDEDGEVPSRSYLQLGLSSNVSYTYDADAAQGEHITSVTIDGEPLDPAADYRVGTFSFLATGGDNFRIFTDGTDARDSGLIDRDAWIDYLTANEPLSPSFARHAVSLPEVPTEVAAGDTLEFTVGGLNLTSLGSPKNTSVAVALGDAELGEFEVTTELDPQDARGVRNGQAEVTATVPASLAPGEYTLTITADPSGTTVTMPVTVTKKAGVEPKLSINARSQCWDGKAVVAVYALNTGTVPTDIRLTVPWGADKKFDKVAPGKAAYQGFYAPRNVVEAGSATIAAYTYVDGVGSYVRLTKAFEAIDCRAASTTELTASDAGQTYGAAKPATLTAKVSLADQATAAGSVVFRSGDDELGSVAVNDKGTAKLKLDRFLPAGQADLVAEFVPADDNLVRPSDSAPVAFTVAAAQTVTEVTARVVKLPRRQAEESGFDSGVILIGTVTAVDSKAKAAGELTFTVNGTEATVPLTNGKARSAVIPVADGTAEMVAAFTPADGNLVGSESGTQQVEVGRR